MKAALRFFNILDQSMKLSALICILEIEKLTQDGCLAAPACYPYCLLREDCSRASKRPRAVERRSTGSDAVLVELEFSFRVVGIMWPSMLQCDTMRRYNVFAVLCASN